MNLEKLGLTLKITSGFITALWVVGLIIGNIYLVLLAFILLLTVVMPVIYIYRHNLKEIFQGDPGVIVEDERTRLINDKAATMTLGISVAVLMYVAVVIVALRNSYPQFTLVGYALFVSALFSLLLYFISRAYYNRKY